MSEKSLLDEKISDVKHTTAETILEMKPPAKITDETPKQSTDEVNSKKRKFEQIVCCDNKRQFKTEYLYIIKYGHVCEQKPDKIKESTILIDKKLSINFIMAHLKDKCKCKNVLSEKKTCILILDFKIIENEYEI
jgi:hypothetical protein